MKQVNPHNVVCRGGGIGYNNNQTKLKNINHQNTSPTCFLINDETFGLFLKVSKLKKNFIKKGALLWPIPRFIPKLAWPGNACRKLRILYSYTFSQVNHGKVKNVKSVCRWKIKFLSPSSSYRPVVNIKWIFRWIVTLLSCWILITLLNFDTFWRHNSTGSTYVDGSEIQVRFYLRSNFNVELWPGSNFHVELWPLVRISHWIVIPIPDLNLTFNYDSGSQFSAEFRHGS